MTRPIATVHITKDVDRAEQCPGFKRFGMEGWRKDSGKAIQVYLPPIRGREHLKTCPYSCGELLFEIVSIEGLCGADGVLPKTFICAHFLDID